jgi:hypothetical protein
MGATSPYNAALTLSTKSEERAVFLKFHPKKCRLCTFLDVLIPDSFLIIVLA